MKKAIAVAAMAVVVVITGMAGASSAAHAVVFFSPAATAVMVFICATSKWFLSPTIPLILV